MSPVFLCHATPVSETPLGAAGRGIAGGLAGSLLLSIVSRVLPALRAQRRAITPAQWDDSPEPTLARALTDAQSPGPEGLAEQFAYKAAAGIFSRDIDRHATLAGRAVHLAYGAAWGMLYGLLQATFRRPPIAFGALYGSLIWLIGPVFLVPAMRLMGRPSEEPAARNITLIVGHLVYGVTLATTLHTLQRQTR